MHELKRYLGAQADFRVRLVDEVPLLRSDSGSRSSTKRRRARCPGADAGR